MSGFNSTSAKESVTTTTQSPRADQAQGHQRTFPTIEVVIAASDRGTHGSATTDAPQRFATSLAEALTEAHPGRLSLTMTAADPEGLPSTLSPPSALQQVPRSAIGLPRRLRIESVDSNVPNQGHTPDHSSAALVRLAFFIGGDRPGNSPSRAEGPTPSLSAGGLKRNGYRCFEVASPTEAARIIASVRQDGGPLRSVVSGINGGDSTPAIAHDHPGASATGVNRRQKRAERLLGLLALLLVGHSINPWLRASGADLQLPGASFAGLRPDTVPSLAPLVVGIPTLAVLITAVMWLRRSHPRATFTKFAWLFALPTITTIWFAFRFFQEGEIVTTRGHVTHSRGLGMLLETDRSGPGEGADPARYRHPPTVQGAPVIYPFWQPWLILGTTVSVTAAAGLLLWGMQRRENQSTSR